jgi:hypothetical protein
MFANKHSSIIPWARTFLCARLAFQESVVSRIYSAAGGSWFITIRSAAASKAAIPTARVKGNYGKT